MNLGKKYITIGDEVISTQYKVIGTVDRKTVVSSRGREIDYIIKVNVSKTNTTFGESYSYLDSTRRTFKLHEIEPIQPISMYSKDENRYIIPDFNTLNLDKIRLYDQVVMVDNGYVERLLRNLQESITLLKSIHHQHSMMVMVK